MIGKIVVFLCVVATVLAFPYPEDVELTPVGAEDEAVYFVEVPLVRARRQAQPQGGNQGSQQNKAQSPLQLQGGGGGSPGQGFDIGLQGKAPVWQSDNGRHQVDVTGQYGQHLGGPYGNSRPSWGVGAGYTFRF